MTDTRRLLQARADEQESATGRKEVKAMLAPTQTQGTTAEKVRAIIISIDTDSRSAEITQIANDIGRAIDECGARTSTNIRHNIQTKFPSWYPPMPRQKIIKAVIEAFTK